MMVGRGGEWSFKKDGSLKNFAEFPGSRSLVFWKVMCVSQASLDFLQV